MLRKAQSEKPTMRRFWRDDDFIAYENKTGDSSKHCA
jgi:hypothetical protein